MMIDFYEKLKKYKELNSLTYSDLGKLISVSGDTFRMAVTRKTLSDIRKEKLLSIIEGEQNEHSNIERITFDKDGVRIDIDEIISFLTINIKRLNEAGKLGSLIEAINTVRNIDKYNKLNDEINRIKELLERNKDVLK